MDDIELDNLGDDHIPLEEGMEKKRRRSIPIGGTKVLLNLMKI